MPTADQNPRLRFWHWYSFNGGPDYGEVRIQVGTNGWQTLVLKERSGGLSYALYGTNGSRTPTAMADFSGTDMGASSGASLKTGKWVHLAGTCDGTTAQRAEPK